MNIETNCLFDIFGNLIKMSNEIFSELVQTDICRICINKVTSATNLFSEEKISKDILDKIYLCFQVIVCFEKNLPSVICRDCIKELNIAHNFRLKCLTSEDRFINLYKGANVTSITSRDNEIKITTNSLVIPKTEDCSLNLIADTSESSGAQFETEHTESEVDNHYTCSICNKTLKTKASLLRHNVSMHQKRRHLGKVTGFGAERRYHCTKCSYSTPHSQTLVNHMRRHNGERPYPCECGKSFTQSSSLAAHRKTHSNATFFTCATCGKQFKHAFTLKKHLQVHEVGKYLCDICHKHLKSRQSLQDHLRRHYNIRNYNCDDCGDTFITCSELLNHKRKHSLVKKIECHLCGYKTQTKKNLVIHLKRHAGDKSFKCSQCELTFYTSGDLRRHQRVHTREKPFSCPTCAQRFTHSTSLNKHMQTVHGLNYKWGDFKLKEVKRNRRVQSKLLELKR